MTPCPECWRTYPHQHMTAMERLDRDDKVCGCGQTGCMERICRAPVASA